MSWPSRDPPDRQGKKLLYNEPSARPKRRGGTRDRNRAQSQFQLSALQGLNQNDLVSRPRPPSVYQAPASPDPMYMETVQSIDYDKVLLPKDQRRTIPVGPPLSSIKGAKFRSKYATPQNNILPKIGQNDSRPEVTRIIWTPSSARKPKELIEPNIAALVDRPRGYRQDTTGHSRTSLRSENAPPDVPMSAAQKYGYSDVGEPLASMRDAMNVTEESYSGTSRTSLHSENAPPVARLTAAQKYGYSDIGEPLASMRDVMNYTEESYAVPDAYVVGSNKTFANRLLKRRQQNGGQDAEQNQNGRASPGLKKDAERPASGRRSSINSGELPGIDGTRKSKSPTAVAEKPKVEEKKSFGGRKHTLAENKAWYAAYKASLSGGK